LHSFPTRRSSDLLLCFSAAPLENTTSAYSKMIKPINILFWFLAFVFMTVLFGIIWSRRPGFLSYLNLSNETWVNLIELTRYNKFDIEIILALAFGALLSGITVATVCITSLAVKWLTNRSSER